MSEQELQAWAENEARKWENAGYCELIKDSFIEAHEKGFSKALELIEAWAKDDQRKTDFDGCATCWRELLAEIKRLRGL